MTSFPPTLARLLTGAAALALTVTACGGADDTTAPTTVTASTDPATVTASSAPAPAADAPQMWLGPLDQFLGFGVDPSAEEQAENDQLQRRMEQLIAECMTAQGFAYTAREPSATTASNGPWDLPPDEFARQYGYGISTIERDEVPSGDPNAATLDAMSVAEKQAYYRALYGDVVTVDENGELQKRTVDDAVSSGSNTESCSAKAGTEVYGEGPEPGSGTDNDAFAPLQQDMSALYDRVESHERVVAARTAWSNCMADAGHPGLVEIYDASTAVSDRAAEAAADPAALEELRTYEVAVATADLACRVDYDTVHREVQTEVETAFVEEHRAELEQYRDAIASGTVGVG